MNKADNIYCTSLALTVEYACLFGISQAIPGLQSGDHVNRYGDKFCIITFHGKADRVFWFIIHKLDQVYTYPDAPRYSPADATELCGKLRHVKIVDDVTVGDLWETKEVASMTALEEGLFENWHFKRIVLLGDSIHKVRPQNVLLKIELLIRDSLDDTQYWTRRKHGHRRCCCAFFPDKSSGKYRWNSEAIGDRH